MSASRRSSASPLRELLPDRLFSAPDSLAVPAAGLQCAVAAHIVGVISSGLRRTWPALVAGKRVHQTATAADPERRGREPKREPSSLASSPRGCF